MVFTYRGGELACMEVYHSQEEPIRHLSTPGAGWEDSAIDFGQQCMLYVLRHELEQRINLLQSPLGSANVIACHGHVLPYVMSQNFRLCTVVSTKRLAKSTSAGIGEEMKLNL